MTPAEYIAAAKAAAAAEREANERGKSTVTLKPQVISDRAAAMLAKAAEKGAK